MRSQRPNETSIEKETDNVLKTANRLRRDVTADVKQASPLPSRFFSRARVQEKKTETQIINFKETVLVSLLDVAHFIYQYRQDEKANRLGLLSKKYKDRVNSLEADLHEVLGNKSAIIKFQIEYYLLLLTRAKQDKLKNQLNPEEVPERKNQKQKLYRVEQSLAKHECDHIILEMKQLETKSSDEQIIELEKRILDCRRELSEIDFIKQIQASVLNQQNLSEKIKFVLWRNILSNFIASLTGIEKQFFWRWNLRARYSLMKDSRMYLSDPNHPIKKSETYLNAETSTPLLNLEEFKQMLKTLELETPSQNEKREISITEDVIEILDEYLSDKLASYAHLVSSVVWDELVQFDDCDWPTYFRAYVKEKLIAPLSQMLAIVDELESQHIHGMKVSANYVPPVGQEEWYDLYLYLKAISYQLIITEQPKIHESCRPT